MSRVLLRIFSLTLLCICACTGARGHLKFKELQYPASMSASLYAKNDTVLYKGRNLQVVQKFTYEKRFWGIFYSWVRLSGSADVDTAMNQAIQKAKGDGMINVRVVESTCSFNYYIGIPFMLLPFTPGCVNAAIEGEIVKVK